MMDGWMGDGGMDGGMYGWKDGWESSWLLLLLRTIAQGTMQPPEGLTPAVVAHPRISSLIDSSKSVLS